MTLYPLVLHLGPIELTGYGLMMMVAFLMAGWAIQLELRRRRLDEEYAADIVIAGVIGGLIGAKVWYVVVTRDWDALLRRGGFVWYGGFLGATAAILLNGWRRGGITTVASVLGGPLDAVAGAASTLAKRGRGVPWRFTVELCAAPLALGYALGRVGCFLVNDDYGIPSNLPWAMKFPKGLPPTTVADLTAMHVTFPPGTDPSQVVAVHPTQIYETVLMFLAFWWMWRRRDHPHATGWLFGCYLTFAGAERFLVEFVRAKDDRVLGPFTIAQAMSVLLLVAGVTLLRVWREKEAISLQPSALSKKPAPSS